MPTEEQLGGNYYHLDTRVSALEHRMDETIALRKEFMSDCAERHKQQKEKENYYDVLVGKMQTSIQLLTVAVNVASVLIFSFLVWEYTQFSTIRDAVLTHVALDSIRVENQKEFNDMIVDKLQITLDKYQNLDLRGR